MQVIWITKDTMQCKVKWHGDGKIILPFAKKFTNKTCMVELWTTNGELKANPITSFKCKPKRSGLHLEIPISSDGVKLLKLKERYTVTIRLGNVKGRKMTGILTDYKGQTIPAFITSIPIELRARKLRGKYTKICNINISMDANKVALGDLHALPPTISEGDYLTIILPQGSFGIRDVKKLLAYAKYGWMWNDVIKYISKMHENKSPEILHKIIKESGKSFIDLMKKVVSKDEDEVDI